VRANHWVPSDDLDADGPISLSKISGPPASMDQRVWIYIFARRDRAHRSATDADHIAKYDLGAINARRLRQHQRLSMVMTGLRPRSEYQGSRAPECSPKELPSIASQIFERLTRIIRMALLNSNTPNEIAKRSASHSKTQV